MKRACVLALAGALSCGGSAADTLVILAERDVEGLDPHTSGQVWQTQMVLANMYESLIALDAQMAPRPGLALAWSNPDDDTWEFELRQGVRFQSGGVLEADDVAFSLERALRHPRSVLRVNLANVDEISAHAGKLRLRTRAPDASLLARLREVFIVSRRCVEAHGEAALAGISCGTGPYALAARTPGDSVDLVRFDGYWGGRPAIPKARFVARAYGAPDADRFVPRAGRLVFWTRPGTPLFERANKQASGRTGPGLAVLYLSFDLRGATTAAVRGKGGNRNPFLEPKVREAVARALDLGRLRRAASDAASVATQLVSPFVAGFDPQLQPPRQDRELARRLLAETPFRDGFEVDLDLREIHAALGAALAEDLAALGIRVRPRVLPEQDFFRRLEERASSLAVLRFSCWSGDAQTFFDKVIHSRRPELGYGIFNFSYDQDPVPGLDADIEAARRELRPSQRLAALQRVMRRVLRAHLAVPLLQEQDVVFASPDVEWTPRADTFWLVAEARFGSR